MWAVRACVALIQVSSTQTKENLDVVCAIPEDRIMIETGARPPFLIHSFTRPSLNYSACADDHHHLRCALLRHPKHARRRKAGEHQVAERGTCFPLTPYKNTGLSGYGKNRLLLSESQDRKKHDTNKMVKGRNEPCAVKYVVMSVTVPS